MASIPQPVITVSVREVVEFVLQHGDLGSARDFVGRDRARAGIRCHQKIQRSRPTGYQKEVSLTHTLDADGWHLRLQGRLDGLLVTPEGVWLEEIKTVQGAWDRTADPLHWAQVKCYGFMYAHGQAMITVELQLTYCDVDTGEQTEFRERFSAADLARFFAETTAPFLAWLRERQAWCQQRDESIRSLGFPFRQYRPGQRQLAVAAYRALVGGGRLFLEAPTGIGKTISVLFPALKAMAEGKLERVFFLTARTVGRIAAEQAVHELRRAGLRLRTLTLTAKEKVCLRGDPPCDARHCPFALGYYDRHKAAMREALESDSLDRSFLETVARKHQVCPFELALDLSLWVDAIVGDYNYVFDPKTYLRRHFDRGSTTAGFLIDEAHNLVDRARDMFSADLEGREIREVQRAVKTAAPRCARALGKLASALRKLGASASATDGPIEPAAVDELHLFPAATAAPPEAPASFPGRRDGLQVSPAMPAHLVPLLETAIHESEAWLTENRPAEFRPELLALYFRLHAFLRAAEWYDERFVTLIDSGAAGRIRLFCLDPSARLAIALERGKAAVFFSATLTPMDYYRNLLGGVADDPWLQLPSPFPPAHLAVLVHTRLRTELKARAETLAEVARAIQALVQGRRGNYLVYFPSYEYLRQVKAVFDHLQPATRTLVQRAGLSETERDAFLAAFAADNPETLVGFAVLGGVFGEGIDLAGDRLIGTVIVGVGLPQLCAERDAIRDYFQRATGAGFEYAYCFPGMNRVLQAAGRVIRSETDRGVVLLLDARFAQARYRRLFSAWWQPVRLSSAQAIDAAVRRFWQATG